MHGSQWRRWDLHVHTKDTNKNDQFNDSVDFEAFCVTMFTKALDSKIAAIGITDYFTIDNYQKVVDFVKSIDARTDFDDDQKEEIKKILILPNVELRMLPVTESGRLVNIHCIFNPLIVESLDNDLFGSIEFSAGSRKYKMNREGFISLGKSLDASLDDSSAYKKGINNFVVGQDKLQELLNEEHFAENVIVAVSNSSTDGASGFQKHFDLFEDKDPGSLDGVRKSIYCISQAIFSGNPEDRSYFLGQKKDDEKTVIQKCGSIKPCIHGSDAHTEDKLFAPDEDRFCWIKSDVTFEGLKQIVYEPADRVYIGTEPPVLDRVRSNKTKYISSLSVDQKDGYDKAQGTWFQAVNIVFNKELVAIIGNKGSGKSALSDIIGVLGNTHNAGDGQENLSFLNGKTLKFRKKGYAENFEAEMVWEDGSGKDEKITLNHDINLDEIERVRYLPQNYFENLTNDLEGEGFDKTLKSVIFLHLPEDQRLETKTFDELELLKGRSIELDLTDLRDDIHKISEELINIEAKKHPSNIKLIESSIEEKKKELSEHDKNKPEEVPDPAKQGTQKEQDAKAKQYKELEGLNKREENLSQQITEQRSALNKLSKEKQEIDELGESIQRLQSNFETYKSDNREAFQRYGLDIDKVLDVTFTKQALSAKIIAKATEISVVAEKLRTKESIEADASLSKDASGKEKALTASLIVQHQDVVSKIGEIKKALSRPEKLFQEYKEKIGKWQRKKTELEGSATTINTLKFFEAQKDYIDKTLEEDLKQKRADRLAKAMEIFRKKKEIVELYKVFKQSIDDEITKDKEFSKKFEMVIDVNFKLESDFAANFLRFINKTRSGTFYGATEKHVNELLSEMDLLSEEDLSKILNTAIEWLEVDQREKGQSPREIKDQIDKVQEFYDYLFSLTYMKPIYELKLDGKILDELSPGEKGTLLLVFYLMIDKEDIPLIIDQPEDNLDNKSVFQVLTHFIKNAKKRRQIVIVTHNPNLAVGADAEQVIYVELDKKDGQNIFHYEVGSIENPDINKRIVEILEGTMPAFDKRKLRYRNY